MSKRPPENPDPDPTYRYRSPNPDRLTAGNGGVPHRFLEYGRDCYIPGCRLHCCLRSEERKCYRPLDHRGVVATEGRGSSDSAGELLRASFSSFVF